VETIIGWKLDPDQRAELLLQFPPFYANVVADHVTLRRSADDVPLPGEADAEMVGRADDGAGVEAMVVRLNGTTDRPDGSTWHITWSLADGRGARESNDVIAALGWTPIDLPMPLILMPARWP
jgi:chitinase